MQQINFTGNLDRAEGAAMFFIIEEAKETKLGFQKNSDSFVILICFNICINIV